MSLDLAAYPAIPRDIKDNAISQLPYLGMEVSEFEAVAAHQGYTVEVTSRRNHIVTLSVRPWNHIMVYDIDGIIHRIW